MRGLLLVDEVRPGILFARASARRVCTDCPFVLLAGWQAGGRCEGSPLRSQSGSTRTTQRAAPAGACWLTVSTLGMLAVVFGDPGGCRRLHSQLGSTGGRRRKQLTSRLHYMTPFALQMANQI